MLLCLSFSGKRRITAISSARMILPGRSIRADRMHGAGNIWNDRSVRAGVPADGRQTGIIANEYTES